MTPEQQRARSLRFSPDHRTELIDIGDGQVALFRGGHSFELWLGPLSEVTVELLATLPPAHRVAQPTTQSRAALTAQLLDDI